MVSSVSYPMPIRSLPSRERELKRLPVAVQGRVLEVAPLAGA